MLSFYDFIQLDTLGHNSWWALSLIQREICPPGCLKKTFSLLDILSSIASEDIGETRVSFSAMIDKTGMVILFIFILL